MIIMVMIHIAAAMGTATMGSFINFLHVDADDAHGQAGIIADVYFVINYKRTCE